MGYIDRYIEGSEHVVLDGNLLAEIEGEVQRFFDSRKWYKEHGIPWRRGFMLQGPPGTGKTSLCRHLASKYKMNIYVVSPSSYTSETLGSIMRYVRPRSILLFEDIDRSLSMAQQKKKKRGDNEDDENSLDKSLAEMLRGNLGVLLNAIDGIAPAEGMMLVMTSNDTKELDPALTRPGRVDRTFHLGRCTRSQAMKMFRKFFPNASAAEEMGFIQGIADDQYSPAELQEKLISAAGSSVFVQSTPVDNLL